MSRKKDQSISIDATDQKRFDKKKHHQHGYHEGVQDSRKQRVNFKRYLRAVEEEHAELDVDYSEDSLNEEDGNACSSN